MLTVTTSIQAYINAMVEDIKNETPVDSGALKNSVESTITVDNNGFEVGISMLDYGAFQDKGVNGTERSWGSPFSFRKNIPSSAFRKYTNSLSGQFVIATSVRKNGIRPKNFIEPNLDRKLEGLANLTADEIWLELVKNTQ